MSDEFNIHKGFHGDGQKMCRVCLSPEDIELLEPLFGSENDISKGYILKMLIYCTSSEILPEDQYPKHICKICLSKLFTVYDFLKMYHNSIEIFQGISNNITENVFGQLLKMPLTNNISNQEQQVNNKDEINQKVQNNEIIYDNSKMKDLIPDHVKKNIQNLIKLNELTIIPMKPKELQEKVNVDRNIYNDIGRCPKISSSSQCIKKRNNNRNAKNKRKKCLTDRILRKVVIRESKFVELDMNNEANKKDINKIPEPEKPNNRSCSVCQQSFWTEAECALHYQKEHLVQELCDKNDDLTNNAKLIELCKGFFPESDHEISSIGNASTVSIDNVDEIIESDNVRSENCESKNASSTNSSYFEFASNDSHDSNSSDDDIFRDLYCNSPKNIDSDTDSVFDNIPQPAISNNKNATLLSSRNDISIELNKPFLNEEMESQYKVNKTASSEEAKTGQTLCPDIMNTNNNNEISNLNTNSLNLEVDIDKSIFRGLNDNESNILKESYTKPMSISSSNDTVSTGIDKAERLITSATIKKNKSASIGDANLCPSISHTSNNDEGNNLNKNDVALSSEDKNNNVDRENIEDSTISVYHPNTPTDNEVEGKIYKCRMCKLFFRNKASYRKHITNHNKYLCPKCGQIFKTYTGFRAHLASHSDAKPFSCKVCQKRYKSLSSLRMHLLNHGDYKKYVCEYCGEKFFTWHIMNGHIRRNHKPKKYRCDKCYKSFTDSNKLKIHDRGHTGERPFLCAKCGKTFPSKGQLNIHLIGHDEQKQFECAECKKTFSRKGSFRIHIQTHAAIRKFACKICSKSYAQKQGLSYHMTTHYRDNLANFREADINDV